MDNESEVWVDEEFEALDLTRFPCVRLAYDALRRGGTAPAVLNAANEMAVAAFLEGRLAFLDIPRVIDAVLDVSAIRNADTIEDVLSADAAARVTAGERIGQMRLLDKIAQPASLAG